VKECQFCSIEWGSSMGGRARMLEEMKGYGSLHWVFGIQWGERLGEYKLGVDLYSATWEGKTNPRPNDRSGRGKRGSTKNLSKPEGEGGRKTAQ